MSTRIKLLNVVMAFPTLSKRALDRSDANDQGKKKYQATFVIERSREAEIVRLLDEASEAAMIAKYGAGKHKMLKRLGGTYAEPHHLVSREGPSVLLSAKGEQRFDAERFVGWVAAREERQPLVIHADKRTMTEEEIDNRDIIYPGVLVNAVVEAYVYDKKKYGVALSLKGIQRVGDGPRLVSEQGSKVADEFDAVAEVDASDLFA